MIPVYPLVNYVEIVFRNQEGLTLNLNCEFYTGASDIFVRRNMESVPADRDVLVS